MQAFGSWLKQRRTSLGLSQKELAQQVGCSSALIRKIEAGERRPSPQIAELLARPLAITDAELPNFRQFARSRHLPEGVNSLADTAVVDAASAPPTSIQPLTPLTPRENDILRLMAQDVSDEAIAERLSLKIGTVRWYVKQIYSKLGVHNRQEAVQMATAVAATETLTPDLPTAFFSFTPSPTPRHNLPLQLSSFVGREAEMDEANRLLATARLVTLIGAGGCGKTRLALQVAAGLTDTFTQGVWLVELVALADPALVPQAVATALGVREEGARPLLNTLLDYLRQKQLLLLLDNCEHLLDACAQLTDTLLRNCSQLIILATSREALNIPGERVWDVPPLSLPDGKSGTLPDNPAQYDAIRLFIERAMTAMPTLTLTGQNDLNAITDLCQRLDGLPLAIELAAARTKTLTVAQIAARLESRFHLLTGGSRAAPPRQQTLQATIEWSYDLLPAPEQTLFCRLAVFAGGWTLEAAEAVCADEYISDYKISELLTQLVNKSLVRAERKSGQETRYRLLETVRQYALEQLADSGEMETMWQHHAAFFANLAEEAEPHLKSAEQIVWLDRLEIEMGNIRAVLERAAKDKLREPDTGLRLAAALEWFWMLRGLGEEGVKWLVALLEKSHQASLSVRAKSTLVTGVIFTRVNLTQAITLLQESLVLYQQIGHKAGVAQALLRLGFETEARNQPGENTNLLEQSMTLFQELNDDLGTADALHMLGSKAVSQGDFERAKKLYKQALALHQKMENKQRMGSLYLALGDLAIRQKKYQQAVVLLTEALTFGQEVNDKGLVAFSLNQMGELARLKGDYNRAATFYKESLALAQAINNRRHIPSMLSNLGYVALHQGDVQQARILFKNTLTLRREFGGGVVFLASCLIGIAGVFGIESQAELAVQLFGAVTALLEMKQLDPSDQAEYERYLTAVRAQLDDATFNKAWAEGQKMTLETAVTLALER